MKFSLGEQIGRPPDTKQGALHPLDLSLDLSFPSPGMYFLVSGLPFPGPLLGPGGPVALRASFFSVPPHCVAFNHP